MFLGVRLHDLGKKDAETLAKNAQEIGFDGVQFVINKAIEGESGLKGTLTNDKINSMAKAFKNHNLKVMMLGAYFNPVHSNKEKVNTFIDKFKDHLSFAHQFDCSYVGTETGSFNDDSWTYNPLNREESAYQEVKRIVKELLDYAKEVNSNVAIEGAYGHCIYKPSLLKRLFDELDNGHFQIIVDVFNYLYIGNYEERFNILNECLSLFGEKIKVFHIKDFIVQNDKLIQVEIGKGIMGWDKMLPLIYKSCPNAFLVFEGVKKEDMVSSYKYFKNLINMIENKKI